MPTAAVLGALASGKGAIPAVPTLSYTGEKQFTITNYDATLTYTLSGCTRVGNIITVTTTGVTATVTAAYPRGLIASSAREMLTLAHARVLTTVASNIVSTGCGPRPTECCPGGTITDTTGNTCVGTGSLAPDNFCGGSCPGNCFQMSFNCYNWYWTDYSGSGYTQQGNVWGKSQ